MADLTGQTPAATYKGLLQVNDYTDGVDATVKYIQDGEGTDSALAISTDKVGIGTTSPATKLAVHDTSDPTIELKNSSTNALAGIGVIDEGSTSGSLALKSRLTNGPLLTRVVVKPNGNVGIGTTSPLSNFVVKGGTDSTASSFEINCSNNNTLIDALQRGNSNTPSPIIYTAFRHSFLGSTGGTGGPGNVGIGTTSFGTNASGVIGIGNATAPTSSPADMVQLYAKDDAGSSRLYVRNEAGTETVLSPHAADAPSSLYDRPPGVEEMHRSANYYLGTIVFTNVDRRNALMQKQLNGEELPEDRTFTVTETFAEYNARTGADLQVEDWDANQQAMFDAQEEKVVERQAEIDAWDNEEEEAPEPLQSYVKKPKPDWLS